MFGTSNGERERNNEMLLDNNLDALPWSLVCVVTGDHGDGSLCYPESTRANGVIACTITNAFASFRVGYAECAKSFGSS